jgi:hypothetical protein
MDIRRQNASPPSPTTRVQIAPLSSSEIERFVSNVIGISLPLLQRWLVGISPL